MCNYYVTYRCNARCSFCDIWEKPSPYVRLEEVEQNLRDLKKLGVRVIDFTGGEPLLHQQIDQFLDLAHRKGFITTLTTNGLLYPKWAQRLKGKVDMLHFSLDSADRGQHDQGRGVACFDFVLESIRVARALGERPDILFTVFQENIDQLEAVYRDIVLPNKLMLLINPAFDYNGVNTGAGLSAGQLESQRLLEPMLVELAASGRDALRSHAADLVRLGFEVEDFGADTVRVAAIPALLRRDECEATLRALADDLEGLDRGAGVGEAIRRIAATMACHAAVKANYPLTPEKMRHILEELRQTAYSTICPHGRPVMLRLTRREIEKNFQRI